MRAAAFQVRSVDESEINEVLGCVLAAQGREQADRGQVRQFRDQTRAGGLACKGWVCTDENGRRGMAVCLIVPGRTAVVIPLRTEHSRSSPAAISRTVACALHDLRDLRLHYAQSLVDPGATTDRALLTAIGFEPLTRLEYLERDARYPWTEPRTAAGHAWVSYRAETHELFGRTILSSYEDSCDCPELAGSRPIDDILASHRATGMFNAALWEVLLVGEEPAGCMLTSPLPGGRLLELVYMGVVPRFRGTGTGRLLIERALELARGRGLDRLTLVMDARNHPARRLYEKMGLGCVAERDALIYRWGSKTLSQEGSQTS